MLIGNKLDMLMINLCACLAPGVIAMSWCPNDSSYLLTCAKDNRTICWDTVSAEVWTFNCSDGDQ